MAVLRVRDPDFATHRVEAYIGDAGELLRELPADSVDCVVTSPPYWNLRDYGVDGQIGLERDPVVYLARMVEVFHEVYRVLAPHGVMFVNMGDSYCASRSGPIGDLSGLDGGQSSQKASRQATAAARPKDKPSRRQAYPALGVKNKDLMGMPWRLAFALQQDGWRLRQDIVWHKPNPMPESVRDRPTKAHEYVFLFAKSERYFFNADAIAEETTGNAHARGVGVGPKADRWPRGWESGTGRGHRSLAGRYPGIGPKHGEHRKRGEDYVPMRVRTMPKQNGSFSAAVNEVVEIRNSRDVWTIATEAYGEAHYATFPRELARRCILAGTPADGMVLDPFVGSGTTLAVCVELERRGVGFDLDPDNLRLIERRVAEAVIERERGESFDSPIVAVPVTDLGPLWEDRAL